jgi:hypothetical protein
VTGDCWELDPIGYDRFAVTNISGHTLRDVDVRAHRTTLTKASRNAVYRADEVAPTGRLEFLMMLEIGAQILPTKVSASRGLTRSTRMRPRREQILPARRVGYAGSAERCLLGAASLSATCLAQQGRA